MKKEKITAFTFSWLSELNTLKNVFNFWKDMSTAQRNSSQNSTLYEILGQASMAKEKDPARTQFHLDFCQKSVVGTFCVPVLARFAHPPSINNLRKWRRKKQQDNLYFHAQGIRTMKKWKHFWYPERLELSSEKLFPKYNSFCNFRASFHRERVGPSYVHVVNRPGPIPTRLLPEVCCGYIGCSCLGKVCPSTY